MCPPAACVLAVRSPPRSWQTHEALRGEHRLQNREVLRDQIQPLAELLCNDACYGESPCPPPSLPRRQDGGKFLERSIRQGNGAVGGEW